MAYTIFDHADVPEWLARAKAEAPADRLGMLLLHNGVVRGTSRSGEHVKAMKLEVDRHRLEEVAAQAAATTGIEVVYVWVNEGDLQIGDDIMYVLVAGDIRPNVIPCLETLVREIKTTALKETEIS